jgi:hypothetical protein
MNISNINSSTVNNVGNVNQTLYNYADKNFFDRSTINNINSGLNLIKPETNDGISSNEIDKFHHNKGGRIHKNLTSNLSKDKETVTKPEEIDYNLNQNDEGNKFAKSFKQSEIKNDEFECNVYLKNLEGQSRRRSAYRPVDSTQKNETSSSSSISHINNTVKSTKDPLNNKEPANSKIITNSNSSSIINNPVQPKVGDFESRRKGRGTGIFGEIDKSTSKVVDLNLNTASSNKNEIDQMMRFNKDNSSGGAFSKQGHDKDMMIGDSTYGKKPGNNGSSINSNFTNISSGMNSGQNIFGMSDSRRHITNSFGNVSNQPKIGGANLQKDKGVRGFMKI